MRLKDTHTYRHPASNPNSYLSGWIGPVDISTRDCINLEMELSASGGGRTKVGINIGKGDFEMLLSVMAEADRGTTVLAVATTLARILEGLSKEERDDIIGRLEHSKPWYQRNRSRL